MKIFAIFALLALLTAPTFAQKDEEHHIDFTQKLIGFDGKPLTNGPTKADDKPTPITLSDIAIAALEAHLPADKDLSADERVKLDILAQKIYNKKDCVLINPELTRIEDRIGQVDWPSNAIVGAAWRILDPARIAKLEKQ